MKKIVAFILVLTTLILLLVGCSGKKFGKGSATLPDGLSGIDAAKLLLANERLDSGVLKNKNGIFTKGADAMRQLADTAMANLGVEHLVASADENASAQLIAESYKGPKFGKLEKDGDTFRWSEFGEYNNSYDYFESITIGIVESANRAAELIDNIKKHVRIVDKWVQMDEGNKFFLHVEDESELLCEYQEDGQYTYITVCRRYQNTDGKDVYELYYASELYAERMTYIPGERYERSSINSHGEDVMRDFFVADSAKGYWETYVLGVAPDHYNVSYFIMKDDICYDTFYDPKNKVPNFLKAMSADRATDIFNVTDYGIDVKLSGFDGVKCVEAPASVVEFNSQEKYANLTDSTVSTLYLTNGKSIKYGDTFVDGKVTAQDIRVVYVGMAGHIGELSLKFNSETPLSRIEMMELTKEFILEVGLECRRDLDETVEAVEHAFRDVNNIIKYFHWNGVLVDTEAGIAEGIETEMRKFDRMHRYYNNVKDKPVVDYNDVDTRELNVSFADITDKSFVGAALNINKAINEVGQTVTYGAALTVESASLTVEDTLLFVEGEKYRIDFALLGEDGILVPIYRVNGNHNFVTYSGEDIFTVTAKDVEISVKTLEGNYTIVAYIVTEDGIRSSSYTKVNVSAIEGFPLEVYNTKISANLNSDSSVTITYTQIADFNTIVTYPYSGPGYEAFYEMIATKVLQIGTPSDVIEKKVGDTYVPMTDKDFAFDGYYRIAYTLIHEGVEKTGYMYFEYITQTEGKG